MSMTDPHGRHSWSTLMRRGGILAVAAFAVAALVGCEMPGMATPADPAAELPEVEQAGSVLEIAAVRRGDLGDDCDDDDKLTLCDTDNGSTWPETHDGDTFKVTLKFSEKVLVHPLVMRYGVFRVRNGRITSAWARGGSEVVLNHSGYSRTHAKEWVLKVKPRAGYDVRLFYPERPCTNFRAICTNKRTLANFEDVTEKPLDHRIRIDVPWEDPDPPVKQDPPSKLPGAVRNVRLDGTSGGGLLRWRAPATHGGAFITEYRIYRGGCESRHPHKVIRHPDDFWQHGGNNGFYSTYIGFGGPAGVRAVNRYGPGPCEDTDDDDE